MPRPENVNPSNFDVKTVIYNDGDFSVALGYCNGEKILRLGMRWNGDTAGDQGYPKTFNHPVWFFAPDALTSPFIGALLPTPYFLHSDLQSLITASKLNLNLLPLLRSNLASLGVRKKEQIRGVILSAEIWSSPRGHSKTVVVSINGPDCCASQDEFEAALRDLLDKLEHLENIENMIFIGGGDFILPNWFYDECRRRGINIHIVTHEENIYDVLGRLELENQPSHD